MYISKPSVGQATADPKHEVLLLCEKVHGLMETALMFENDKKEFFFYYKTYEIQQQVVNYPKRKIFKSRTPVVTL